MDRFPNLNCILIGVYILKGILIGADGVDILNIGGIEVKQRSLIANEDVR